MDLFALPEKIFSPFSFSCQKSFFCFSKIISPLLWISLKKICPPFREKVPCAFPLLSYLYGSLPLWEFLFPLLMRVDGLFSMESMTADMECTTIRVPGFLFCPPKGSLIQPQYFLIRCIFPDLKII